jgi:hypothetical protein
MITFKKISIHILVISPFIVPLFVFAVTPVTPPPSTQISGTINNPFKGGNDLMSFISTILSNVVMPIAAVAVVIWIVWAGFTFVLAQGKEAEITKAKSRLLWSLIGAGILLGAVAIAEVVKNTVGALINTP